MSYSPPPPNNNNKKGKVKEFQTYLFSQLAIIYFSPFHQILAEYCGGRSRYHRRSQARRQHQSGHHPSGPDGDGLVFRDLLPERRQGHVSGELWGRRPHHNLLWRQESQGGRGVCSHRQSECSRVFIALYSVAI